MEWKSVTIFISSTFNDMHLERDYLVKNVFPELREWCEERKIHLVDVDLRWGVTAEDTENDNALRTCLKNIDKSRPFFLCFLGQRRGWVPSKNNVSGETEDDYPDIMENIGDKSITEMEVEHALLAPMYRMVEDKKDSIPKKTKCPPSEHALFYFREDNYTNKLNDSQKLIYTNEYGRYDDFGVYKDLKPEKRVKNADNKLNEFKKEVTIQGKKITYYKGEWDYQTKVSELVGDRIYTRWDYNLLYGQGGLNNLIAKENKTYSRWDYNNFYINNQFENLKPRLKPFKEVILQELKDEILDKYPEHRYIEKTEGLQKELDQQDLFRELNSQGFIERTGDFDDLNSYIHSDDKRLFVLTAKAGLGKTTLITNYITNQLKDNDNVIYRFAGVSDDSASEYNIWKSILEEAEIEIPPTMEKLKENKKEIFEELAEKKAIILIDGINQVQNGLAMVDWIDKPLQENLKIILSFKEDEKTEDKIQAIKNNNQLYFSSEILPLDNDKNKKDQCVDRKKLIEKYLESYLKALDEKDINIICKVEETRNPLLLKILLSELRLFGVYEELSKEIQRFGKTPEEAFNHVLERLEKEDNIKGFIPLLFGLLANAQVGLSTTELKEIISKELPKEDENLIIESINLFIRQVKVFMARREGRYDYFYDSFKKAAKNRYKNEEYYNCLLADYFQLKTDPQGDYTFKGRNPHDFKELPYHLANSNKIATLEEILSKYTWIKNKSELNNIYNTINDYKYINIENKENYHLKMIKNTLYMSSHILKNNIKELPTQLWGRLKTNKNSKIQKELLNEIEKHTNYPWLKPHHHMNTPEEPLQKTLKGHTKSVESVCFSSDGKYIASGSGDETVRVWNMEKPHESPRILKGHTSYVYSVCFSCDGKYIASGSYDKTVRVWNMEHPDESPRILKGHTSYVYSVCFSSDGKYIASGSADGTVRVWNMEKPDESPGILGHRSGVFSVCFSSDCKYIASGSGDGTVRVWNMERPDESPRILKGHRSGVFSVCFSSDCKYIASGSWDVTVRVWNMEKPDESPRILKGHTSLVNSVCFSCDGKYIASGSWDVTARVWNMERPDESPRILKGHASYVSSVCFSCDGKYIASGSGDETVRVWNMETPDESPRILKGHTRSVSSVCFSSDGKYIASGSGDETVRVWNLEKPDESPRILKGHASYVSSVCFSSDCKYISSRSGDGTVRVWNLERPDESPGILGHTGYVYSVCFSSDCKYIASGSGDGTVRVWNMETHEKTQNPIILLNTEETIRSCDISKNNQQITAGESSGQVLIYSIENLKMGIAITTALRDEDNNLNIRCSYCAKNIDTIKEEDLGTTIKCPYCKKKLKINDFTTDPQY
ncbi:MAG: DUF4062 domain-containing protein [Methanobrevibacter sp.]|nr:DUF4062 domain-containing protein [Methanobrevibacter sp.]